VVELDGHGLIVRRGESRQTPQVRVGVLMLPTDPWPEALERARRIEALGYDHLWTYDHVSWRRYRGRTWFAAIPWLTGMAGATSRVRLGTMVSSPNMRHPVTLAQDAVTTDHVSGGRLILGVGAGGIGFDATLFGDEPLSPGRLLARLDEFVELLDRLLREPTVSYRGTYFTVNEACIRPAGVQSPRVPIAIAAAGPRSLELVARRGDAWITILTPAELTPSAAESIAADRARRLDDACAAIGRDPAEIRRIYLVGSTGERPLASVGAFDDFAGRYAALGFTDLVFHHPRPDDPVWDEPESIVEDIAADVLPRLQTAST
jgi:alkanesulfonate monooxygenase SsuD/methylene tetrahydromethanopterin reductase-like flavin-dependent oxidoreductase (luciferase family)